VLRIDIGDLQWVINRALETCRVLGVVFSSFFCWCERAGEQSSCICEVSWLSVVSKRIQAFFEQTMDVFRRSADRQADGFHHALCIRFFVATCVRSFSSRQAAKIRVSGLLNTNLTFA
jgi:hypothetical protein